MEDSERPDWGLRPFPEPPAVQGGGVLWARGLPGNQKEIQGDKVDCYRRPLHSKVVVWSSAQPASWGLALMLFV